MQKTVLKSKTFYFGLLSAIAPLFPAVADILKDHPAEIGMVWGTLTILLRLVTKSKLVLTE